MEAKEEPAQKHQPFRCKEEEEPEKAAWREEPEQLLKLATEKLRTAPRKDSFLEEPEGSGKGWGHLDGPGPDWRSEAGSRESGRLEGTGKGWGHLDGPGPDWRSEAGSSESGRGLLPESLS